MWEGQILVYTTDSCRFCQATKTLLEKYNAPFITVNINEYPEEFEKMKEFSGGLVSLPQIFFNDTHIGGNMNLQEYEEKNELINLLLENQKTPIPKTAPTPPPEKKIEEDFVGKVVLFTSLGCDQCHKAKYILEEYKVPFEVINLSEQIEYRKAVTENSGMHSVPQLYFNNKYIGGYQDMKDKIESGEFDTLIEEVKKTPINPDCFYLQCEILETAPFTAMLACEDDEVSKTIAKLSDPEMGISFQKKRRHFHSYRRVFAAKDLIDWLIKEPSLPDITTRIEGAFYGQMLLNKLFIKPVLVSQKVVQEVSSFQDRPDDFYRLISDRKSNILNSELCPCTPDSPQELCITIRNVMNQLYIRYLSKDGTVVDYENLSKDPIYDEFLQLTLRLQRVDLNSLDVTERKTFFLNIYNSLMVHCTIVDGAPTGALQRARFFSGNKYIIAGLLFSLTDIEHGVLRGNSKPPGIFSKRVFQPTDPRCRFIIDLDPRIHFALNCGAKSCPPIKSYHYDELEMELDLATRSFLENECTISEDNIISLTMLFKWYASDFGSEKEMLLWISNFCPDKKKKSLQLLVESGIYKISYNKYHWN